MPAEDYQAWSITAGTNASADTGINWAEGQPRASVNNSARSMMAAHAKDRNLRNGSIVTGGAANVQTFTSGVSYTGTVPTGLVVKLKVGFTNTARLTLNMDGIGAVAVKDMAGVDVNAGAFVVGRYVDLVYNGTNWILLLPNNIAAGAIPECGRLESVVATACSFRPFKGDQIKINGAIYNIPSGGIVGLGNTGCFLNGVGGQSLAANSIYWVYVFDNAGVLTADFSTTHATSATAGNVGVEIKSGDDTRTLIGAVYTSPAAQFVNTVVSRTVISWFNRRRMSLQGANTAGATLTATTLTEVTATARTAFLTWGNEAVEAYVGGSCQNNVVDGLTITNVGLDGGVGQQLAQSSIAQHHGTASWEQVGGRVALDLTEGFHFLSPTGNVSGGGTGTWYSYISGSIRG